MKNEKKIRAFMEKIKTENYFINRDGTIDVDGDVTILASDGIHGKLPDYIQFGCVLGTFSARYVTLDTLRGCPKEVGGSFRCSGIASFEHAPRKIGKRDSSGLQFSCPAPKITSLEGIANHFDFICNDFNWPFTTVTSGGLGLLLIPHLKYLSDQDTTNVTRPFKIIEKYLGDPENIFDCQEELVKAGFEEFAKI